jgi:hypothetical protein
MASYSVQSKDSHGRHKGSILSQSIQPILTFSIKTGSRRHHCMQVQQLCAHDDVLALHMQGARLPGVAGGRWPPRL